MRPETHIFHLPTGECIVTLENMYMLLGLPTKGKAVNGNTNLAKIMCEELLGANLIDDTPRGQCILLTCLKTHYRGISLTENSTEQQKIIKIICYIMLLIVSFLFPYSTGCSVHIMYLPLLRNIDKIGTYSWCYTCLSYIFNSLCKTAKKHTSIFYGYSI